MSQPKHSKRKPRPPHVVQHHEVIIEDATLREWIEYMGYVLHDVDLSLGSADLEIVEILETFEKDFRELAEKNNIEWRDVWGDSKSK